MIKYNFRIEKTEKDLKQLPVSDVLRRTQATAKLQHLMALRAVSHGHACSSNENRFPEDDRSK